jgi:HD superfamily phosphohydrolase
MRESRTRVVVNGDIRRLDRQSPLVDALRESQRGQWRLGVYAPREATDQVGTAAVRELGLDIDGALVREVRTGLQGRLDDFEE